MIMLRLSRLVGGVRGGEVRFSPKNRFLGGGGKSANLRAFVIASQGSDGFTI